jgi:hypothetical protein
MEKKWTELTPEQKREERFKRWLSPDGVKFISPEAEEKYKERVTRFIKAIKLEEPDRVPVYQPVDYFPAYYSGTNLKTVMYDYDELKRAWIKYIRDFNSDLDIFSAPIFVPPGRVWDMTDYKMWKWPGHGLADDAVPAQFVENEYMLPDEYDALIRDQADFTERFLLPRTFGGLKAFQKMRRLTPAGGPFGYLASFGDPEIRAAYQLLLDAGQETVKWMEAVMEVIRVGLESGLPIEVGTGTQHPFDVIADNLRGTTGIMTDMFRRPDKLHEAAERLLPILIEETVISAENATCPIALIALHKANATFMSSKQFETFYWPDLKKLLMGLVDEGLVPMPFAEGDYEARLDIIKDMPRGSVIWYFEQMDMAKAKRVLGDNNCIAGNVPASLIFNGTAQEVKEYCRRLIETCGEGGGYILGPAVHLNKTDPENFRALMAAAREFGVYKK